MRSSLCLFWLLAASGCMSLQRPPPEAVTLPFDREPPPATSDSLERGCPESVDWGSTSAIRSPDALVRLLLVDGCRQSPTLRQLAHAIGGTDGVVYVSIGPCPTRALRGCLLHTIRDTGNARYLWIRVSANSDAHEAIGTIAHELQHAFEVLTRADVRSTRDLLDFYQSFRSRAYGSTIVAAPFRTFETEAAVNIGTAVRAELAAASRAVAADERE